VQQGSGRVDATGGHSASSSSIETLCDNLAQHIESEEKQQRFVEQARRLLDG
jgi:hypothetical protein